MHIAQVSRYCSEGGGDQGGIHQTEGIVVVLLRGAAGLLSGLSGVASARPAPDRLLSVCRNCAVQFVRVWAGLSGFRIVWDGIVWASLV